MRAVLHDEVDRDAIDDAAARLGWQLVNVVEAARTRPEQLIFAAREGHVYVLSDERLAVRYLQVEGDSRLLEAARRELLCYGPTDHHELCAAGEMQRGLALAVLHASGPDEATVELLGRALASPDEDVRAAAFVAITYAPWPALRRQVETMRDGDANPELRDGAARWLAMVCP